MEKAGAAECGGNQGGGESASLVTLAFGRLGPTFQAQCEAMARFHDEDDDERHIDMRPLLRIGAWGACAVIAVTGVVYAGRTDVAAERAQIALTTLRDAPREIIAHPGSLLAWRPTIDDGETRRLGEAVRQLTADRDRLATRVATLEQNLTDLTGSIARTQGPVQAGAASPGTPRPDDKAEAFPPPAPPDAASPGGGDSRSSATPAEQPAPASAASAPPARASRMATIQSYVSSSAPPAPPPAPSSGPESRVAAAPADATPPADTPPNGFAIDLGTATNVNTLRAHWGAIRSAHAAMLEGLRPLVSVRQSSRPGFTEFHLVAGPVADADAAARLCQALASARVPCRPATFDGQRLDLR
jgi:hypothetical protein